MKIGIYKPYKSILFNDENDTSSWSRELTNLIKLFASKGHEIYILSETDYQNNIMNVFINTSLQTKKNIIPLDILFISNGVFDKDIYNNTEDDILNKYKDTKKILLCTDLELTLKYHDTEKYDIVLSQTNKRIKQNFRYGHLEKLFMLFEEPNRNGFEFRKNHGIFCGHERKRYSDIKEFVLRPEFTWYGKSNSLNRRNLASKSEFIHAMKNHRYTIVISDKSYYDNAFVTQRYYEGCLYGIVNFVIDKYDSDELCIKKNDIRRVSSYEELYNKIQNLNKKEFLKLQQKQFNEIQPYLDGEILYINIMNQIFGE